MFQGNVYATPPTIEFGKLLLLQWLGYQEIEESMGLFSTMEGLYTRDQVEQCVANITPVSFNQTVDLPPGLSFSAVSSGYCIGGCNWLLQSQVEKIAIVTSSAASMNRHPEEIDIAALMVGQ